MERFGNWTAYETINGQRRCVCDCGAKAFVAPYDLKNGKSKRCRACAYKLKRGVSNTAVVTHGMDGTTEYRTWTDMRRRCHSPQRPDYKNYGGRGIFVCEEWRYPSGGFEAFFRDMGRKPDGHTLERIDNAGPYSKENCKWATSKEQDRNKQNSVFIEVEGQRMNVMDASEKYGVSEFLIYGRVTRGWSGDDAVFIKPRSLRRDQSQS